MLFEKGSELVPCVNQALAALRDDGTLDQLEQQWLSDVVDVPEPPVTADGWQPSDRELERRGLRAPRAHALGRHRDGAMVVVFVGLGLVVISSPGWPRVQETFFNWHDAKESFPAILDGFWINVKLFLIAEPSSWCSGSRSRWPGRRARRGWCRSG